MDHEMLTGVVIAGLTILGFVHFLKYFVIDIGDILGDMYRWFKDWRRTL